MLVTSAGLEMEPAFLAQLVGFVAASNIILLLVLYTQVQNQDFAKEGAWTQT